MKRVRLMILAILVLFALPLAVNALPLENFAENPIPYWEDDSLDINLTWDSTEQTVTIEDDTKYWEDMSDVSDWVRWIGNTPTSDGYTMSWEMDGDNSYDLIYSNSPDLPTAKDRMMLVYVKSNTSTTYLQLQVFPENDRAGGSTTLYNAFVTDSWVLLELSVSVGIESIMFYAKDTTEPSNLEFDYVIIDPANLSLAVPIEPDTTQSIELMGNFSALDSTVRFQIYDDATASDLFCDVNATQVTFPDSTYAEFTNFARINFSLDAERMIFRIYVSAQNTTLINYYSYYEGLANKDSLRMNDSGFEGSFTLWYLQGDIGYLEVIDTENIFYLLFLSLEMWGYLGPIALVIIGFYLVEKSVTLGVLWFIVECLFVANYLDLVEATPHYWWHIMILLLGGLFTCIFPLIDRR